MAELAEVIDVELAELQSLRQEISTRISLMNALVALELAAVGTGLTIAGTTTDVLAGLAAISSFLWLLYMDQSFSTYKIAAYLAIELAPRMSEYAGHPTLGWEGFLRRVEAGGQESGRALYPGSAPPKKAIVRPVRADWYVPLLFGATPPLLLALYVISGLHGNVGLARIVPICTVGTLIWVITITRFIDFVHNMKYINKAIVAASTGPLVSRG